MTKKRYDQKQLIAYFHKFISDNDLPSDLKLVILSGGTCARARQILKDRTIHITTHQIDRFSAKRLRNRIKYEIATLLSFESGSKGRDQIFRNIATKLKVKTSKRNPNKFLP